MSVLECVSYSTFLKRITLFILVLTILGCQSGNETDRQIFIDFLNKSITKKVDKEKVIHLYRTNSYKNVKLLEVKEINGETHLILEYWDSGCRIAKVIKNNVYIDWYYVANKSECYTRTDWLGPW